MPATNEKVVTSGREWRRRREEGTLVQLPSGNVARLRPVSLLSLMKRGRIPDPLSGMIDQMIAQGERPSVSLETYQDFADLIGLVCQVAFVEPRIVDEPTADDEIGLDDVGFEDQTYVFNWAQQEIRFLMPFRPGQESGGDLEAAPGGDDLSDQAQRDSGARE